MYINPAQRAGLGASVSIALADVLESSRITLDRKDLSALTERVLAVVVDRGEWKQTRG